MISALGGDWAGSVYPSRCPSTCVGEYLSKTVSNLILNMVKDFVNNNPGAFKNAFFDFASIRIYQ